MISHHHLDSQNGMIDLPHPRAHMISIFSMTTGVLGLSPGPVGTVLMALITSMPSVILPKTGCFEGVLVSNQSRKALCLVLMKNCEPPESGAPVLAIDSVPISLEIFAVSSSGMLPPPLRVMVVPSEAVKEGPPVPARGEVGSFESRQPNCPC